MWVEISWSILSSKNGTSSSSWGCELKYISVLLCRNMRSHPLREDVSWNVVDVLHKFSNTVILFVRMWVEIFLNLYVKCGFVRHPLREDVSWNAFEDAQRDESDVSSSSWGCELKYFHTISYWFQQCHPLRDDVSWNMLNLEEKKEAESHPLREDVSWNERNGGCVWMIEVILFVRMWVEIASASIIAGCSIVILFVRMWVEILLLGCRILSGLSSSSWGCELKCLHKFLATCSSSVILFVRMWVEISNHYHQSTYHLVILFVRMWVEIILPEKKQSTISSSSSWGCELKYWKLYVIA